MTDDTFSGQAVSQQALSQQALSRHQESIGRDGYTVIPNLLTDDEVEPIRAALAPYLQGHRMGRNDFEGFHSERVYALLAKDPAFGLIIEHPAVLGLVDQFLRPMYLLSANLAINVHPGETPQGFHRDNDGGPFASRDGVFGISTIWAFDDFTEDNGATEVIAGSHLWEPGVLPARDDERAVKVVMPRGSVMVFTGHVYHRGGANNSNGNRLAITPQYCQSWMRQLENMVLAVPPEKARDLSPRVQSLLGYSIRDVGFMGYVDGMHPKRLLDDDYQGRKARGIPS
jgi:ectoine hydroxylase-related dioxygenase (phytanoyl-CoA dioxygenase family)